MATEPMKSVGYYMQFDAKTVTAYRRMNLTNKTGFLGIKWNKSSNRYEAYIRVHDRKGKIYAGSGKTPEEAARKYDAKAVELFGHEAVTNFPQGRQP